MQNVNLLLAWMIFDDTNSKIQTLDEAAMLAEAYRSMGEAVDIWSQNFSINPNLRFIVMIKIILQLDSNEIRIFKNGIYLEKGCI